MHALCLMTFYTRKVESFNSFNLISFNLKSFRSFNSFNLFGFFLSDNMHPFFYKPFFLQAFFTGRFAMPCFDLLDLNGAGFILNIFLTCIHAPH